MAYTSVGYAGFAMFGIATMNVQGLTGAVVQLLTHGLATAAIFVMIGALAQRRGTTEVAAFGGLAKPMPVCAAFFGLMVFSLMGFPLLGGFIGDLFVLLGSLDLSRELSVAALASMGVAASYLLWVQRRVFFGPVEEPANRGLIDLDRIERGDAAPDRDSDPRDRRLPESAAAPHRAGGARDPASDGAGVAAGSRGDAVGESGARARGERRSRSRRARSGDERRPDPRARGAARVVRRCARRAGGVVAAGDARVGALRDPPRRDRGAGAARRRSCCCRGASASRARAASPSIPSRPSGSRSSSP